MTPTKKKHCLLVDAHPLVRLGLRELLNGWEIDEVATRDEAVELVTDIGCIDVVVLEMRNAVHGAEGELCGIGAIKALRRAEPQIGIVAHGERPERRLATEALQAGAGAFVSRAADPDQMRQAIIAATNGGNFIDSLVPAKGGRGRLTKRQRQILQRFADGDSSSNAAADLGLSEETVKTHTKNILKVLVAKNRAHAVAIGLRDALID